jgi:hypothetical protein
VPLSDRSGRTSNPQAAPRPWVAQPARLGRPWLSRPPCTAPRLCAPPCAAGAAAALPDAGGGFLGCWRGQALYTRPYPVSKGGPLSWEVSRGRRAGTCCAHCSAGALAPGTARAADGPGALRCARVPTCAVLCRLSWRSWRRVRSAWRSGWGSCTAVAGAAAGSPRRCAAPTGISSVAAGQGRLREVAAPPSPLSQARSPHCRQGAHHSVHLPVFFWPRLLLLLFSGSVSPVAASCAVALDLQ